MTHSLDIPSDPSQEIVVQAEPVRELRIKLYVRTGVLRAEAEMGAARQIEADLRGIHSHGSRATPRYLKAMDTGDIDPRGQVQPVTKTAAMGVLDGGRSLG